MVASIRNSFFWSLLEQGGVRVTALVIQIILARLLSPDVFGLLAILLVFTSIADVIAQSGLGISLVQKASLNDIDCSTAFWLSLVLGLTLSLLLFVASPFISSFYSMADLLPALRVLSLVVILNSVNSIQRSYLQRKLNFKKLCIANILAVLGSGLLGIGAAFFGAGIWALVLQTLAQSALMCLVLFLSSPWHPSFKFSSISAKELYGYGWKVCFTGVLGVMYTGASELVIGKTCSPLDLGYYSQGRKWPNAAIAMVSNAMQNVFLPAFSSIQNDIKKLSIAVRKFVIAGSFVVIPVSILFAVIAKPAIVILLTDAWLPCVPVFQMTCLSNVVLMLQLVNLRAYMALGHSGLYLKLQFIKVLLGIVVIFSSAMLTRSIYGVAIATAFISIFNVVIVDLQPAKDLLGYGRISQLRDTLPIVVFSCVAAAASFPIALIGLSDLGTLIAQLIVFLTTYLLVAYITKHEGIAIYLGILRDISRK